MEPGSKLAATGWVAERVAIEGCPGFTDDAAYAAMDFLLDALDEIAAEVFGSVAHLLNLDLDIVFVDTTSTYWETETADDDLELADPVADDEQTSPAEAGTRAFGHSKDHRADLPQVVIAMAVTRDGVPVRCWTFPGDTADTAIIRTVKDDLGGWGLRRLVWVADRGFASAANRAYLTRGGGHYIHAEKLRHTNTEAAAALARPGRYRTVADNLRVKEVAVAPGGDGDGDQGARTQRFVICHNPEQADARPAGPRQPRRAPAAADRRLRHLDRPAPRRAGRQPQDQARAAPLPAPHPLRAAADRPRPRSSGRPTWTASGCCAPPTSPSPPTTWPPPTSSCSPSNAAGATSRARSGCARCSTTARTASAPTSSCAGWRCCSCG